LKFHPLSELFPLMQGREFDELVADVKANGLREPIWTYQGEILDGRNRWRACEAGQVSHRPMRDYEGADEDALAFVLSLNLHRRHLNESQRGMVAAKIATLPRGANQHVGIPTSSQAEAARQLNVSRDTVIQARKVIERAEPEVTAAVERGELAINMAAKLADAEPEFQRAVVRKIETGEAKKPMEAIRLVKSESIARRSVEMPTGKYRVIYADPPWSYGNTQPDYHTEQRDHYPVMTLGEICAMPVRDIVDDDAVLFLWVTSPILEEAFDVIRAWGFNYKASFVWDKVAHNMGHYNSVRHEFLLVCTRGSCTPDVRKLFDSVVSEERTEHSKKPVLFYEIIETLYPHGARVELFARGAVRAGWAAYGNQAHAA
jgi:N6-adenosine-specific RNA methylase IME4/ParB-like chromosome segregation protein Spo0J